MSKFEKSSWVADGENNIRLTMPLCKVDQQNRLVSGFATLDNIDSQGDVVLAEASVKAFARARGNLREMHQSIAVGRIVDFREEEYYDSEDGKFYRGIYVTARVSEGAEDTWVKVLDGTLSGFSIGGSIVDASTEFVKDANKTVRFIKDYELIELSLVDNPANQLANVFSIQKSANGSVTAISGMLSDTKIENVFYCEVDSEIQSHTTESAVCLECGNEMENIGWFEQGGDRAEKVREVVSKFRAADVSEGGGTEMATNITKSNSPEEEPVVETEVTEEEEAAVVEETPEVEEEVTEEPVEETEEAAAPEEVTDEEEVISKKIDELKTVVQDTLEKSRNETLEQVAAIESRISEVEEKLVTKASELENKINSFGEKLETSKARLADLEKSLDKMNSSDAFRKSSDVESEAKTVQKSKTTWNGAFSVDNLL